MSTPPMLGSALLERNGFEHGFFTRIGGTSAAAFAGLNLASGLGDDERCVEANLETVKNALGARGLVLARQVHGTDVKILGDEEQAGSASINRPVADVLITNAPGWALGVLTADCVPILIADPASGAVAAVHAGWRGTLDDVAGKAAAALSVFCKTSTNSLIVCMGPAIGPDSYEVDEDLAEKFLGRFGPDVLRLGMPKPRLDLWAANAIAMISAGLRPGNIEVLAEDTLAQPGRFFSHRRDGTTGRQGSFIMARPG